MTVSTCSPSLLTTNPVTPFLSLILSGAGFPQVTVMEVVFWLATERLCGGPVGTGEGGESIKVEVMELLYAVMANVLLLLQKGCSRCAWNVKELS